MKIIRNFHNENDSRTIKHVEELRGFAVSVYTNSFGYCIDCAQGLEADEVNFFETADQSSVFCDNCGKDCGKNIN